MKETITQKEAEKMMNLYGTSQTPFFFMIDFEGLNSFVRPLCELEDIQYNFRGKTNTVITSQDSPFFGRLNASPPSFGDYQEAFNLVQQGIHKGDSYLVNLTFKSPIDINHGLDEIYYNTVAPYRLLVPGYFTMFSPESFVQIRRNMISSFPMKGTIRANIPNAKEIILTNLKETAEHSTIVDLIRNDLSMVSKNVQVQKWRYIDKIDTSAGEILQVSSSITGQLSDNWSSHIGTIISTLLPAGSISGAPKKKTLEIIRKSELRQRGWYSGVCGIYDGLSLDSAVMIRMITEEEGMKFYHSGGGITAMSDVHSEYKELQDKIYVPTRRNNQNPRRQDFSIRATQ